MLKCSCERPHPHLAVLPAEGCMHTKRTHFMKCLATSLSVPFVVDDEAPLGADEELDATDFLVRTCSVSSSLLPLFHSQEVVEDGQVLHITVLKALIRFDFGSIFLKDGLNSVAWPNAGYRCPPLGCSSLCAACPQ